MEQFRDNLVSVIINPIMALLFAAALLVFMWGVVNFLFYLNTESEKREQGKWHMLWGILGMFVMLAAYTIVKIIGNTIGVMVR